MRKNIGPIRSGISHFHHQYGATAKKSHKFRNIVTSIALIGLSVFGIKTQIVPIIASTTIRHQAVEAISPQVNAQKTDASIPTISDLPKQDKALERSISKVVATFPKEQKWSVYVQDLESNRAANVNADRPYESASLYKLFLLAPLESKMSADKWSYHIGNTNIKDCVNLMLRISDNDCAKSIAYIANWNYVDQFNKGLGYNKTTVSGVPQTTASEVGDLLINLKRGKLLSDKARRMVFDALYAQKFTDGLPSGCSNCRTANKTGQTEKVTHDAGIITHGQRSYVLVVMSEGGNFSQIAQITRVVEEELNP